MNTTLINILQSSPTYSMEEELDLGDTMAIRYLVLSFDLILLTSLNHVNLRNFTLFSFYVDKFFSDVQLTVLNDFDFFQMKYDSNITLSYPKENVNDTSVFVDSYKYEEQKSQSVTIKYKFQWNEQILSSEKVKVKFNFGSSDPDKSKDAFAKFTISDFQYRFYGQQKLIKSSASKSNNLRTQTFPQFFNSFSLYQQAIISNYDDESGSYPLVYLNEIDNLKDDGNQAHFLQLISTLQPHTAANTTSKQNHMFICHDMMGGYAEDTKFNSPIEPKRSNSYRYNYFWHTSIFNYFSHKTISIPPRHWRELCKKYEVKCLGTLISEGQKINQTYYISNQFALKLVYLAKKYKFDGYLINIEDQIKDIERLKGWLKFLTQKIHEQIPGSMISWYDSVTTQGTVEYQNEINQKNKIFYDLTDSFFTNYWWNDQKLKDDLKQAQPNKPIYVGNDVWGRGTFGGGEFFTYKGVEQIQKFNQPNKPSLVPALFAPAYTYETGGKNNNPYFKASEDRLYRGVIFDRQNMTKWDAVHAKDLPILALSKNTIWHTKSYSTNLWLYKNKNKVKLNYLFKIKDNMTSPNGAFDYKIVLRHRDTILDEIHETKIVSKGSIKLSQSKSIRNAEIVIETEKMTSKTNFEIFVATTIGDVFSEEFLLISHYMEELDWIGQIPLTTIHLNDHYNTFFNVGHGQQFFLKGKPILKSYDYLADYDLPHTLSINHPFWTSIEHHEAFIGGSSLVVTSPTIKLFYMQLPSTQFNYPVSYNVKIVSKGGPIESLFFSQTNGFSIFLDKTSENKLQSQWIEETFELSKENLKKMKKKFFKQLETSLSLNVKSECLLGQVLLRPKLMDQPYIAQRQIKLTISQSFKTVDKNGIFINAHLSQSIVADGKQSIKGRRYLLKIDEKFLAFIYMERERNFLRGRMEQIWIKFDKKVSTFEVIDVDSQITEDVVLYEPKVGLYELSSQPLSHKIHLTNY